MELLNTIYDHNLFMLLQTFIFRNTIRVSNTLQRLSADDNSKSLLARTELIQVATVLQLQTLFQNSIYKMI